MHEKPWRGAEVRFIDREEVIQELKRAVAEARMRHPEIGKVLLFGSFVRGDWAADSDADLIVVVRKEFQDVFDRGGYAIFTRRFRPTPWCIRRVNSRI